jgi:glucose/arabinose dehydrogenase
MVVRIDGNGYVETLLEEKPTAPIAVTADPVSGDILVANNRTNVLSLLPVGQPKNALRVIQIKGHEDHWEGMSVAFAQDGHLLFSVGGGRGPEPRGPNGTFRFRAEMNATLGRAILPDDGAVAADPLSKRWVTALVNDLRVFEETREILKLPYPLGKKMWFSTVAFGPDGNLVIGLYDGFSNFDVFLVDLKAKTFHLLFSWNKSRVVSLAVGPKTAWKE